MIKNSIKNTLNDSIIYFIMFTGVTAIAFISTPIYTRLFPPTEYGYLSLINVTISLLSVFSSGPLSASLLRYLPNYNGTIRESNFYTTLFLIQLILMVSVSIIYCIILILIKNYLDKDIFNLFLFGILIFIMTELINIFLSIFRSCQASKEYGIFMFLNKLLSLILGLFLLIYVSTDLIMMLSGVLLALIISNIVIFLKYFNKKIIYQKYAISKEIAAKLIYYGMPLIFSLLSQWVLGLSGRYIIEFFRGSYEVGIYSLGYDISFQSISLLVSPFIAALTPSIINTWEHNKAESEFNLQKLSRYFLMISMPALIGFNILSESIIVLLATPQYYSGRFIFPFVSIASFFMGLYLISYTGLIIHKKTLLIAKIAMVAALINFFMNILLVPRYGYIGAGVATMTAYISMFLISERISMNYLKWKPPVSAIMQIFISSAVMGILLFIVTLFIPISITHLVFEIFIGLILYLIILYSFHGFNNDEIEYLRKRLKYKY
ncbi:MAG: oligosaccharide flippase family protein [Methanothrix sp.]